MPKRSSEYKLASSAQHPSLATFKRIAVGWHYAPPCVDDAVACNAAVLGSLSDSKKRCVIISFPTKWNLATRSTPGGRNKVMSPSQSSPLDDADRCHCIRPITNSNHVCHEMRSQVVQRLIIGSNIPVPIWLIGQCTSLSLTLPSCSRQCLPLRCL